MTKIIKHLIFIIINLLIIISGLLLANVWQHYDLEKCNTIRGNDYYWSQNNCYTTEYKPVVNQTIMFILIILFPLIIVNLIWVIIIIESNY